MTTEPPEGSRRGGPGTRRGPCRRHDPPPRPDRGNGPPPGPGPSARTFLLNDLGDELPDGTGRGRDGDALAWPRARARCGRSRPRCSEGDRRRRDRAERIHQSRVAMRRIRSNLRPSASSSTRPGGPRCGPSSPGTATRSALPGPRRAGRVVAEPDPRCSTAPRWPGCGGRDRLAAAGGRRVTGPERAGPRRTAADRADDGPVGGPPFKAKAARPAAEVLPAMLRRTWHDVRGAGARPARTRPTCTSTS